MKQEIRQCKHTALQIKEDDSTKEIELCEVAWNILGRRHESFLKATFLSLIKKSISSYIQDSNPYDLYILNTLKFPFIFQKQKQFTEITYRYDFLLPTKNKKIFDYRYNYQMQI